MGKLFLQCWAVGFCLLKVLMMREMLHVGRFPRTVLKDSVLWFAGARGADDF